jgi:3-hydroxyacyl-CoA dehydrogenase/3a,7a,12a-trihydroxy-5b-cholest-24-enoyl-CoA hydratase
MMQPLDFRGKTVLITGSTRGIGYAMAACFASRGADLVINGTNEDLLSKAIITLKGYKTRVAGVALPVNQGEDIVSFALDAFSRIDVVINNAGIIRDAQFSKMTLAEWDEVYRVNLEGAFRVSRAIWPHLIAIGGGRILMTASDAGLFGNFGQSNYSAMKAALVGLTRTLALEGKRHNIQVNAICPAANTDMTDTLMDDSLKAHFTPERVGPIAAYLCHERCRDSGSVISTGAGMIAKGRYQYNAVALGNTRPFDIDDVHAVWPELNAFATEVTYPAKLSALYESHIASIRAQLADDE